MSKQEFEQVRLAPGDALVVVDLQNDFLPGGTLAVPEAHGLIDTVNRYIAEFTTAGLSVFATRDWHPSKHCSFLAEGGRWPAHCVAGSDGAAFPSTLALPDDAAIVDKGTAVSPDAYSGFQATELAELLHARNVSRIFVLGLATDYCVKATAIDAIDAGFDVMLLEDGMRAVNVEPGDGARAIAEMHAYGAVSAQIAHPEA